MKSTATILAEAAEAQTITNVPASQITRYPYNRQPSPEAIAAMKNSVIENGIIQPLLARPVGDTIQLVFGETRWQAAYSIDPAYPVPTRIVPMDDREAAKLHAIENFERKNLTPVEEAQALRHLLDVGWNLDEVMAQVSREKDWCYRRLSLLKLPPEGQQAVNEGNLPVKVAAKIADLPADRRLDAIKACVTPTHSPSPLQEREALALLQKQFIAPLEAEQEWNAKKKLLLRENPGATVLEYREAVAAKSHNSDLEPLKDHPSYHLLSPAAQEDELVVPTWGDLAKKHSAPTYIGLDWSGSPTLYVNPDPLIEAEKAAHQDKPGDCIFTIEGAHTAEGESLAVANERRKLEREQAQAESRRYQEALNEEIHRVAKNILYPVAKGKLITRQRILASAACSCLREDIYDSHFPQILEIQPTEDEPEEDHHERALDQLGKLITAKDANPFEVLGRIYLVSILERSPGNVALYLGDTDIVDPFHYPLLAQRIKDRAARLNAIENDEDEKEEDAA